MSRHVLVTDVAWPSVDVEREILAGADVEIVVAPTGEEDELVELARDAVAIMTCWKPVTAAVLEAAERCVTVARYGVGLDNIDVAAATRLGMVVTNVPGFCTTEVADHTMALILSHARHIVAFAGATRSGSWDNRAFGPLRRLGGQVLGLVGYGSIAQAVATRARAFGYEVVAYSPSQARSGGRDGVRFATDLVELLCVSDVVSLHVPLTSGTRHLIGRATLAEMKRGALLVNTSRGAVVDEHALLDALDSGRIGGAALDVLDGEPPDAARPVLAHPAVVVTPHAAFDSAEAILELQETAARNVATVLGGDVPAHVVNPEVLQAGSRTGSLSR